MSQSTWQKFLSYFKENILKIQENSWFEALKCGLKVYLSVFGTIGLENLLNSCKNFKITEILIENWIFFFNNWAKLSNEK